MVLIGYYLSSDRFQLQCEVCKSKTDIIDNECVQWHLSQMINHVCFRCEGVWPDVVPDALDSPEHPYMLVLDGDAYQIDWPTVSADKAMYLRDLEGVYVLV